jgi:hypothetical protein
MFRKVNFKFFAKKKLKYKLKIKEFLFAGKKCRFLIEGRFF